MKSSRKNRRKIADLSCAVAADDVMNAFFAAIVIGCGHVSQMNRWYLLIIYCSNEFSPE